MNRPVPQDRQPVEYAQERFEHGDIVIMVSTAKVQRPWVTLSVCRRTRDPEHPSRWLQWQQIDDAIAALKALQASAMGIQAEALTEDLFAYRNNGGYRNVWGNK